MQHHSFLAASTGLTARLPALCHSIASNYFALEAYVPAGAIFDIFRLQGRDVMVDGKAVPMNGNYYFDSLLQNFAYAIEHYFHFKKTSQPNANKYFAKYVARVWEVVPKLSAYSKDAEKCMRTACALVKFDSDSDIAGVTQVKALATAYTAKLNDMVAARVDDIVHAFGHSVYVNCLRYPFELFWTKTGSVMKLNTLTSAREVQNLTFKLEDTNTEALDTQVFENASKNLRTESI